MVIKSQTKISVYKFLSIILCIFCFFILSVSVKKVHAETSPYRSAGWIATDGSFPYSTTTGCQVSNDGLYCSKPIGAGTAILYFGSFGQLEDFGIPVNSKIEKIHIRIKGKNNIAQLIGVNSAYNQKPFKGTCLTPSDFWQAYLGLVNNTVEFHTSTLGNGLANCVTANNINFHNLTLVMSNNATGWFADIDNFEIAFDYTPPAVTPTPVVFPDSQKGLVWKIGPDKTNLKQVSDLEDVVSVAAWDNHLLALKSDGTVWAWGRNEYGQLGDGSMNNSDDPVQVKGPNGEGFLTDVKSIGAGDRYSLVLMNDGTVWTWGENGTRHRGIGNDSADRLLFPVQVKSVYFSEVIAIVAGGNHSLALNANGTVVAWGSNSSGQLGIGCSTCGIQVHPVLTKNINNVKSIAAGRSHSIALKNDGTVWGWGRTQLWELAESGQTQSGERLLPVQIIELSNIRAISSKYHYNLAINNEGNVLEWGEEDRLRAPKMVTGISNASLISAGRSTFSYGVMGYVIKDDNTLWELYVNDIPAKKVELPKNIISVVSGGYSPALAVVNTGDVLGDSTVKPFLDLPWDYASSGKTFDQVVYDPEAWFDHKYPLQNIGCCTNLNILQYTGFEKPLSYRSHSGYDYALKNGVGYRTPVLAAASGSAEFKLESKTNGLGNTIKIDHSNGYQTWYGHLDPLGLLISNEGSKVTVTKGQKIGETGYTGNIFPPNEFGAHIHFSVFKDANNNGNFDDDYPFGLVDPLGWEGEQKDPWTEYGTQDLHGAESFKLFTGITTPVKQLIPKSGGELSSKNVKVKISPDSLPLDFTIHIKDGPYEYFSSDNKKYGSILPSFFLEAFNSLGDKITQFLKPVLITYDYSDADLSNTKEETLKTYYYDIEEGKWLPLPSTVDIDNKLILSETSHFTQFAIMGEAKDQLAPVTESILTGEKGQEDWYRSLASLELKAQDEGGSGIDKTLYSVNGEEWQTYTDQITFDAEGDYKIEFQSADKVGNIEDIKNVTFHIDKTVPVTSADVAGTEGQNGWYMSDVTVKLTADDNASGISKTEYSMDNGETYLEYNDQFTLSKEGASEVLYRSIDKAGNVEENKKLEVKIDKTAPESIVYTTGTRGEEGWYRTNVQIAFNGNDEVSGFDKTFYSLDNENGFVEYINPIVFEEEGLHKIFYYSMDVAGNKEDKDVLEFSIDKTPPVVLITANPDSLWPPDGKMVDVRISGQSEDSNLKNVKIAVTDEYNKVEPVIAGFNQIIKLQAWRNGNDKDGRTYKIEAVAEDFAGNKAESEAAVLVPHDQ